MSLHSGTLTWFRTNQSLLLHLNIVYLAEKQQVPISSSLVLRRPGLEFTFYRTRGGHDKHYTTDAIILGRKINQLLYKTKIINHQILFLLFSGILWSNGDHWKHIRKFATHALKDIAFHRSHLEENILEESDFFISSICEKNNIQMDKLMPKAVSNIISILVFGSR